VASVSHRQRERRLNTIVPLAMLGLGFDMWAGFADLAPPTPVTLVSLGYFVMAALAIGAYCREDKLCDCPSDPGGESP
jgi:hypothetical protein